MVFSSSDASYQAAKVEVKGVLERIIDEAVIEESIDVVEFERIISEKTGWTKEEIIQKENEGQTRSSLCENDFLSSEQNNIINEIGTYFSKLSYISDNDVMYAEELCSSLPEEEKREIIQGVLVTKVTIDALYELENEGTSRATGSQQMNKLGWAVCTLAVSSIGDVWSAMVIQSLIAAGATTAGAGAVAGGVVLVGTYLLGKYACPKL